jgi:MEMO1 family protein
MIREPVVAGMFYPDEPAMLKRELDRLFEGIRRRKRAKGGIVPHAGYAYSGKTAAQVFSCLAGFQTYVILGFSHSGLGGKALSASGLDWRTPLGVVETDRKMLSSLVKEKIVRIDDPVHAEDHCIEVQLPFIRHIEKSAKIVAVSVGHDADMRAAAAHLASVVEKQNACLIASSDFTHYGLAYGYVPFIKDIPANLKKLDLDAVSLLKRCDSKGFLSYVEKTGATICGTAPLALLADVMKMLHAKGELLDYTNSGDVTDDWQQCVGYAGVIYRKG